MWIRKDVDWTVGQWGRSSMMAAERLVWPNWPHRHAIAESKAKVKSKADRHVIEAAIYSLHRFYRFYRFSVHHAALRDPAERFAP